jgi:hypothetical protein
MMPDGGMKDQANEKVKKLVERFRYKWMKYKYWIYCLILTLAVISIIYYVHPNECPENARYILSAISQGLAAILALVFTITLVVAQMTRRYTAMDKIIFRRETKFLMIFFGIGIIAPLLVLEFGFWKWGVYLSIAIASFCVFSLFPFLIGVNRVLKYEIGFVNLYGETLDAIKLENEANVIQGIIDLESICKDAIKESREDTTSEIIHFLSKIGEKIIETGDEELRNATRNLIVRLGNIGIDAIEKGFKDVTLFFLAKALSDLRRGTAKNKWGHEAGLAADKLKEIGCKAAEKGLIHTTNDAIVGLKYCDSVDVEMKFNPNHGAVRGLCYLGVFATEYLPSAVVDHVINILEEFDQSIITSSTIDLEKSFVEEYPDLKTSLDKFKRQYCGWQ